MSTLFIGDSDIELWDTDSIFPNSINLGIGGNTCIDVLDGIDKTLLFEQFQPEWVVVVCGENDLAYGRSAANTFDKFVAVVDKINISGARALYLGTKPEPSTTSMHASYREYDELIRNYADSIANSTSPPPLVMIDVYPSFEELGNPSTL